MENDEITTIDFLYNLLESYKETEVEVENEIDMEASSNIEPMVD